MLTTKVYAGIGARATPTMILTEMTNIGKWFGRRGWTLRSGGAKGADTAFENGCKIIHAQCQIFLPNDANTLSDNLVQQYLDPHIKWAELKPYVQKLFSRNMFQVLGADLNSPSEFVICWTPEGQEVGGTRIAIRCAKNHNVPVYNLALPDDRAQLHHLFLKLK